MLVRAMRDVDARATIVGKGPQDEKLKQLPTTLGVSIRIHFTGRLERGEVKKLFHSAQVFAFPSVNHAESFGIVQIKAMATGLPVVNTHLRTTVPLVAQHDQEASTERPECFCASVEFGAGSACIGKKTWHLGIHSGNQRIRSEYFPRPNGRSLQ